MAKLIGEYEFSVIPCSLSSIDGKTYSSLDRIKLMHLIEEKVQETEVQIDMTQLHSPKRFMIIEVRAVINKITFDSDIRTCAECRH